ncbi:MAG: LacI family DNA-binding transcriptional regulator [Bifidobacteriaceae bacterium]|nr:LacI family DNA-binding transcriptional regulator [Bifidobacteriaceae bacterium]
MAADQANSRPTRPPALRDVAVAAGVSHQTVSRVVNGNPRVLPATRERVLQAIEELGYRRNHAARALATSRTRVLGVVVVNTRLYGPSGTLLGIEQAARQAGYWVSVASVPEGDATAARDAIGHFLDQGVDGLAVVAQTEPVLRAAQQAAGACPTVLVTSGPVEPTDATTRAGLVRIDIDQAMGVGLVVSHLAQLGHRQIAHLAGPTGNLHAQARLEAWRRHVSTAGLTLGPLLQGDWSAASGYALGLTWANAAQPPTAVFAANDTMAQGLLRALHEEGWEVPRDVSVVGFDDSPGTDQTIPPLTTVRQDLEALGKACVEALVGLMEGFPQAGVLLPPGLVVRDSTARPPAAH